MQKPFTKKNFKCDRYCGECCKKLTVKLTKSDIAKIKELEFKEKDFVDDNLAHLNIFFIKNDHGCFFLNENSNGKFSCKIHDIRPKTCRQYPFFGKNPKPIKSCLPQDLYLTAFKTV
jgi:Fe-S-cluster containining protein|tara:strand:- start:2339 stop:2689 length:351 start_codon:yes stop_codon:yes gene_type:complete